MLDNRTALNAAATEARSRGFAVEIASDINEQEIGVGCDLLLARAQAFWNQSEGKAICLLSGGEFSCPVRGNGVGGRNLETVLRCAIELDKVAPAPRVPDWSVLSAGTDGVDGNSSAAGAAAEGNTIARARSSGLAAKGFLDRSDAFHFFEQVGGVIVTGPTGTNVRDIRVVLFERTAT
ncbi:MAG TPA: MOFRL family protein [Pyrinomonadaceae bacterium]|nr:MOFRL family protein [Pyrinomonadaceae bacterium]